jgi:hypothetical protein
METEGREGRSAGFERVCGQPAIALPVAEDGVDDAGVGNKRDDAHAGAAGGVGQGIGLTCPYRRRLLP